METATATTTTSGSSEASMGELAALVDKIFDACDTNKDGNIDEEEALQLAEKVGIDKEHAQSRWAEVKAGIDLNKDGKLSREEFGLMVKVWEKRYGTAEKAVERLSAYVAKFK